MNKAVSTGYCFRFSVALNQPRLTYSTRASYINQRKNAGFDHVSKLDRHRSVHRRHEKLPSSPVAIAAAAAAAEPARLNRIPAWYKLAVERRQR